MIDFYLQEKESNEVYHSKETLLSLEKLDIDKLIYLAKKNNRRRIRFCAHESPLEDVHEMFIVHPCGAYVRPHRHLNKIESMLVLKGKVDYVVFNGDGSIRKVIKMGDLSSGKMFYNSLRAPIYHTLLIRSEWLVFLETTKGPFDKKDTSFPDWSPNEEDKQAVTKYLNNLEREIKNGSLYT